ncbi:hypothetical protein AYK24_04085 [Thermoplasmatales archaeon SG8-52-4]|nr:MAG: hypothetical protein AYK24_04085 [Thermoplasmatales archaeon SG8-52-4]
MNKKIVSLFLCMLLLTVASSVAINVNTKNEEQKLMLVKINTGQTQVSLPKDIEIVGISPDEWIDVIVPEDRLYEFSNLDYEVIHFDLIAYDNSVRGQYHTLAQMENILQDIASDYPDITDLYSIGTTYESRDIWCLEISDNPGEDEGEPGVLFMGLHHAREWPTIEICLYLIDQLTSEYGYNSQITNAVDNNRIWVVTCVNPDGYYYSHDQSHDWRKNRRPITGGIGIDLNRNYAGSSNGAPWGAWGSVGPASISNNPSSELYCGPSPFSEAETQAIRDMFLENDIHASISWHTHGQLVLWPWAYSYDPAPDYNYLMQVAQDIASEITKQSGSGTYLPQQGAQLYPTTGDTTDWVYGYGHYNLGRPTFVYTIEACADFHPSESYLDQIVKENFDGALVLLDEAENIRDTVTSRVLPPKISEMDIDVDGDYTVSWEQQNPIANPSKFQLDELIGPNIDNDDAESGSDYWNLEGFSLSTSKYHSSSHSYKSGEGNNQVHSMATVDPIPITSGMNLDFWCWYDIEFDYDKAFVEVSLNSRSFDLIDTFTGSSSGWEHKQYPLDDYANKSIFIRFRYTTDDYTLEEGIYIDDISPVVKWDYITTLSDTITNNYYNITAKEDGIYYYQVKGYNSEHEWADFSTIEKIIVEKISNYPPNTPTIEGPTIGKPGQQYNYTISAVDPEGNDIYFYIQWGDGDTLDWTGPYLSGEEITLSHSWDSTGTYTIKVKAKDIYDDESSWAELIVKMPRERILFNNLFERFPRFYQFLQYLNSFILEIRNIEEV